MLSASFAIESAYAPCSHWLPETNVEAPTARSGNLSGKTFEVGDLGLREPRIHCILLNTYMQNEGIRDNRTAGAYHSRHQAVLRAPRVTSVGSETWQDL